MKRKKNTYQRGSLTVEAIISFTVFLMVSFLMLHLVKLTMLSMALQNATTETAKQIATAAYPIAWVNVAQTSTEEKVDDLIEENVTLDKLLGTEVDSIAGQLLGAENRPAADLESTIQNVMKQGADYIWNIFGDIKGDIMQKITANVLNDYLDASNLTFDKSKVRLRFVKIPQTDSEFEHTELQVEGKKDSLKLVKASSPDGTDNHYNQDDVVICTEYDYQIALPMLPKIELTLRSVSIEHAWLTGCLVRTNREEGLNIDLVDSTVYIASGGYGQCFHRDGCRMVNLRSGKVPVSMSRAEAVKNYRPCKVCNP